MLALRVQCKCGNLWQEVIADSELQALDFDDRDTASFGTKCPHCPRGVDIGVERTPDNLNFHSYLKESNNYVSATLTHDIDFFTDLDVSDYLENVVARRPDIVFSTAIAELDEVYQHFTLTERDSETFNRMLLNQMFAILETYLADRLIRIIERDEDALKLFVGQPQWSKRSIPFTSAFDAISIVRKTVIAELSEFNFHRFDAVDSMYRAVFGASIFASEEDREYLFKMKDIRNDCVHRNGRTVEGVSHKIVIGTVFDFRDSVYRVYHEIEQAFDRRYFLTSA